MSYQIVVSCDAQAYQAWQVWALAFSVRKVLGASIQAVVHQHENGEDPLFRRLESEGHDVVRAPTYKWHPNGGEYPPRNVPGSLMHASTDCDLLLLFDPDMIVLAPLDPPARLAAVADGTLNWSMPYVRDACARSGVVPETCVSVIAPYVVPARIANELAQAWMVALDTFRAEGGVWDIEWAASMYAFAMACVRNGWAVEQTDMAQTNWDGSASIQAPVLHYCYSTPQFDKRRYHARGQAPAVWSVPPGRPGTVNGAITGALAEARPR